MNKTKRKQRKQTDKDNNKQTKRMIPRVKRPKYEICNPNTDKKIGQNERNWSLVI